MLAISWSSSTAGGSAAAAHLSSSPAGGSAAAAAGSAEEEAHSAAIYHQQQGGAPPTPLERVNGIHHGKVGSALLFHITPPPAAAADCTYRSVDRNTITLSSPSAGLQTITICITAYRTGDAPGADDLWIQGCGSGQVPPCLNSEGLLTFRLKMMKKCWERIFKITWRSERDVSTLSCTIRNKSAITKKRKKEPEAAAAAAATAAEAGVTTAEAEARVPSSGEAAALYVRSEVFKDVQSSARCTSGSRRGCSEVPVMGAILAPGAGEKLSKWAVQVWNSGSQSARFIQQEGGGPGRRAVETADATLEEGQGALSKPDIAWFAQLVRTTVEREFNLRDGRSKDTREVVVSVVAAIRTVGLLGQQALHVDQPLVMGGGSAELDCENISFWTPGSKEGATLGLLVKREGEDGAVQLCRVEVLVPLGIALLVLGWHGGSGSHASSPDGSPRFHAYVRVTNLGVAYSDPDPSKRGAPGFTSRYAWAQLARPGFTEADLVRQALDGGALRKMCARLGVEIQTEAPWAPAMDSAVYVLCGAGNDFGQGSKK
jgi:hypothetical protein